ncbi:MAG: M23 family peptidase, partial [Longispora sp.]|nr:M23 family peptidase [Longispora sp. (in: high G+C Gram-positive bacteria)]
MTPRNGTLAFAGVLAVLLVVCGLPVFVFTSQALACGVPITAVSASAPVGGFEEWNAQQVLHAATIVTVGKQDNISSRGWVVALATAMQESNLRNLANTNVPNSLGIAHEGTGRDHDSLGLFQQRPLPPEGHGGWGTVAELMSPPVSARKFYAKLKTVAGWEQLPITTAAQRVQVSALPDAYARWEQKALALASHVAGIDVHILAASALGADCEPDGGPVIISPGGWTQPVIAPFDSNNAFRSPARPTHQGVDLMADRYAN